MLQILWQKYLQSKNKKSNKNDYKKWQESSHNNRKKYKNMWRKEKNRLEKSLKIKYLKNMCIDTLTTIKKKADDQHLNVKKSRGLHFSLIEWFKYRIFIISIIFKNPNKFTLNLNFY